MRIIGITGGVGSGKSAVLEYVRQRYGASVIQADAVGHQLMRPDGGCYEAVIRLLGSDIVKADQELDRAKIAARVYADGQLLKQLNKIIHPAVKQHIIAVIEAEKEKQTVFFFIEAALLLEDHYDQICDEIWYVYADQAVRCQRLKAARGYTDQKIAGILANQMSEAEFQKRCDFTIDNSNEFEDTRRQIDLRMQRI